ncbi:aspartate kinase [Mesonia sp. K7]|uniref:aspartate kinase n=1 Tax=Mesonia sp. K7 TaxID=2218606 RepID=UPI000DA8C9E7|nr:aspartate kinase [Mesonia sp. K7]PZD78452.1 aspartate kinase [Mesonia sp. K7]
MLVLKFGGTSVGSVENIEKVKTIVDDNAPKIVVLSAMSGSTNNLVAIAEAILHNQTEAALKLIAQLKEKNKQTAYHLIQNSSVLQEVVNYINQIDNTLLSFTHNNSIPNFQNTVLAQGELFSTFLVNAYLNEQGIASSIIPALDFMRVDKEGEPDLFYIQQNIKRLLSQQKDTQIFITQGFISLDARGEVTNLQRGGSDYTATIIGAAIKAEEVQIWTDIDGFHNNDPRFVENTYSIPQLSFDEAAELAYFGAKILHPQTVLPVRALDIPVRLKNTMQPEAEGTLISNEISSEGIKAIAAKDGITVIKIKSERMLLAHGFLKRVFEIFEKYQTAIDMVTTSEIAVSLTIDNTQFLDEIVAELEKFSAVTVEDKMSIVCLAGNNIVNHPETSKLFQILNDVSIRMIAYGGSNNNISLLINTQDKPNTLQQLNHYIFKTQVASVAPSV